MAEDDLPARITDLTQLEQLLSEPTDGVIKALSRTAGDFVVLGVGGKMGPTLARMIVRGLQVTGQRRRVFGVSRFHTPGTQSRLQDWGIQTVRGDLLDRQLLAALPDAPNVIFMAGMKFGSTGREALTWAMNTHLPALVCERFPRSRTVAFSTGNVYGLAPISGPGSTEDDRPAPVGEYAMSCLGRERMFEYFSRQHGIPTTIIRLNYANEMRYGVLVDLARQVMNQSAIDLSMGYANVIWQGDANAMCLCALPDAASPPLVLNVAGPERMSVRQVCLEFGRRMNKPVQFVGQEAPDALLSHGGRGHRRYGRPRTGLDRMVQWVSDWVQRGGASLDKPTHFESREGQF